MIVEPAFTEAGKAFSESGLECLMARRPSLRPVAAAPPPRALSGHGRPHTGAQSVPGYSLPPHRAGPSLLLRGRVSAVVVAPTEAPAPLLHSPPVSGPTPLGPTFSRPT